MNFYFFTEHNEGDLDCFGDLKYLSKNDIKRAMRFTDDDILFASNLKMLVTRRECTIISGRNAHGARDMADRGQQALGTDGEGVHAECAAPHQVEQV